MSHHYKYDETGLPSSYLGLIILLPLYLYYLYKAYKPKPVCHCATCKTLKKPKTYHASVILFILPIIISYLLYNIFTIKIVHKMLYDPYKILGIEQESNEKEIKRAFKKIVKTSDPDKVEDIEEKNKMTEYLQTVNHAYNLLRDKKKLDKFNSVTKETEEIVAIPKKLIENGWFLFVCYMALLCGLLPFFAIKKWHESTGSNRIGIKYDSVDTFYRKSKNDLLGKEMITGIRNIIWLLCESEEIKGIKTARVNDWVKNEIVKKCKKEVNHSTNASNAASNAAPNAAANSTIDKNEEIRKFVKNYIEYNFGYPLKETKTIGYFILMDYLFRTNIFNENERKFVVDKCIKGIEVLKKIAIAKNLKDVLESIFVVDKMLHQAIFDLSYSLMQYPGIKFEDVFMNKLTQKSDMNLPYIEIKNVQAFVKNTGEIKDEVETIRTDKDISTDECKDDSKSDKTESVVKSQVGNKKVFKIEKDSIVTVKVTLERGAEVKKYSEEEENSFLMKMKGENDVELLNTLGKSIKTRVHAPFLPFEKNVTWSVVFYYNNDLVKFNPVFSDFEGRKDVYFEMESEKNGNGKLKIMVKCGQYFDLDKTEEVTFDYV